MKFWNKWSRKIHRWLSIPMFFLVPISVALKVSGNGKVMAAIPQWEMAQSLLMLMLVISGAYLYFLPSINKWARERRRKKAAAEKM